MRCSTCDVPLPPEADNPLHPFCSQRCRQVDLGRWLGGEYQIPGPPTDPTYPIQASEEDP